MWRYFGVDEANVLQARMFPFSLVLQRQHSATYNQDSSRTLRKVLRRVAPFLGEFRWVRYFACYYVHGSVERMAHAEHC